MSYHLAVRLGLGVLVDYTDIMFLFTQVISVRRHLWTTPSWLNQASNR